MSASKQFAIEVVRALRGRDFQAYLCGGCVRDLLLGREPADYDVTTDATPEQVMRIFPQTYAVGAQFGVVLVPILKVENAEQLELRMAPEASAADAAPEDVAANSKASVIEVATFRSDVSYSDGRHPDAVRFSRERVRDELTKMLTEGHARSALLLLDESGLLIEVLPEISAMQGVEQPPQYHPEGDVYVHTLLLLEKLPHPCPPTLAWGALLHDVGKPPTFRVAPDRIRFDGHVEIGVKMVEAICRRLRFSNDDTEQILALVNNHMRFAHVGQMKESTLKKFLRMPKFEEHLDLHRMDCQASHGDLTLYEFAKEKLASIPIEEMRPAPLVNGDDLIAAGYAPGPGFKEILSLVEDAQLEGRLRSKQDAMAWIAREFPTQ